MLNLTCLGLGSIHWNYLIIPTAYVIHIKVVINFIFTISLTCQMEKILVSFEHFCQVCLYLTLFFNPQPLPEVWRTQRVHCYSYLGVDIQHFAFFKMFFLPNKDPKMAIIQGSCIKMSVFFIIFSNQIRTSSLDVVVWLQRKLMFSNQEELHYISQILHREWGWQ